MGLWYFLILILGVSMVVIGAKAKSVPKSTKLVIISLVFGILLIMMSLFLFLPGSSTILDKLFGFN
ncbi:hypothetical protein KUA55_17980 [Enterococcus sp. ALS3]|uniref:Uncharacterized protein n=1 Tax=Enterococcus alishanensis TaxID=1303817 RepID=A0ABS6THT2_9ENTE|nr:hypothetical protein [Enterococcus alishanensis]MBV7392539.1 hypothetical protein [Enterococcus alishanensis]